MFESAEIKHAIDEDSFKEQLPALREALLEVQFEQGLAQGRQLRSEEHTSELQSQR